MSHKTGFSYGYVVVIAAFFILVAIAGVGASFGVFFKPLIAEFGWSRAMLSGASSLNFLLMGLLTIAAGILTDKFGPRIVMTVCGVIFGLGYLLMSQTHTIWQLYLFIGVIGAIGPSGADVIALSTTARWFVRQRSRMSGIVKTGTGVGLLIAPLLASGLINAFNWRIAYVILGVIALVLITAVSQLLRRPTQEQSDTNGQPAATVSNAVGAGLSLREAARTRQFWEMCAAYLTLLYAAQTVMVHIAPHAIDLRVSAENAAAVLAIIGGTSIPGRLIMGTAGDKIGNRLGIRICFGILLAALLWLQLARQLWALYLFAGVYGFAHGGFFALFSPALAELFGMKSHGAILGVVVFSGTIGGAIGPFLAGYIFDTMSSYQLAFWSAAAMSIVGLMLMLVLKPISRQPSAISGQQ